MEKEIFCAQKWHFVLLEISGMEDDTNLIRGNSQGLIRIYVVSCTFDTKHV